MSADACRAGDAPAGKEIELVKRLIVSKAFLLPKTIYQQVSYENLQEFGGKMKNGFAPARKQYKFAAVLVLRGES
ncbi:MAG: hypothetical protein II943_10525 [Victivallales bacterium]|nr:hypothetical protein [Victivallales bacterium]